MKKLPLILLAMGVALVSCNKEPKVVYSENPIVSISVTCSGETVEGVVDDAARKVNFTFNEAESFSNCDLLVELNEGWTLTYPKTLTGVDLQSTPTLNFMDHKSAVVKYGVTFSSNAFPIVDAAKIQIEGLEPGENISLDNAVKVISVVYDADKIDMENVQIIFNEGALQEGCTAQEDLLYDFTDGLEQPLVLNLGGERPYTLKLDVSSYIKATPESLQFVDVTATFGEGLDGIEIYKASELTNMPAFTVSTKDSDFWVSSNPRPWELFDEQAERWGIAKNDDGSYDKSAKECARKVPDYFFPGDWAEDYATTNTQHCYGNIAIVYIDQAKYKGDIVADIQESKTLADFNNAVAVTGLAAGMKYLVYDDNSMAFAGGNCVRPNDPPVDWRNSLGFTSDGKISYAYAANHGGELYKVPVQTEWVEGEGAADIRKGIAEAADEKWEVKDAAWAQAWAIREGKSLKCEEMVINDASGYISDCDAFGMGWCMLYTSKIVIGQTYDNKIAIMATEGGSDIWDGTCKPEYSFWPDFGWGWRGYCGNQMIWLAQQLGWRNAAIVTNSANDYQCNTKPCVKVNGQPVVNGDQGASSTASYFITFDKR